MTTANDYGIGYAHDEFAGTTASPEEVRRLARLVTVGGTGAKEYRYAKPTDDDEAAPRPCNYPPSLDGVLRGSLRQCGTWDQANAVVEMLACQISQTGFAGQGRRATTDEREWAHMIFAGLRAKEQMERVPGTCRGCNSDPCRCVA